MAAQTIDTLLVRIDADLDGINKELKKFERRLDQSQKRSEGAFRKIAGFAKLALGAVIVQQVGRAGLELVNFASHVEEMQAKSGVVFGRFADGVRTELASFGEEVGRSRFQLEEMAASVQDTFVPLGFARGEASKLSVQLTKLATDVASFNNASDTETMQAFQSALVGNHETVRRFGIVITEGTLQAELYRMGIQKTTQQASNAEKVQARLNLILNGTSDAHGDAARTADSFANQSKALSAALDELAVSVITPMLGDFAELVKKLTESTRAFNEFLKSIGLAQLSEGEEKTKRLAEATAELAEARQRLAHLENLRIQLDAQKAMGGLEGLGDALAKFVKGDRFKVEGEVTGFSALSGGRGLDEDIEAIRTKIKQLEAEAKATFAAISSGTVDTSVAEPEKGPEISTGDMKKATDAIARLKRENSLLSLEIEGSTDLEIERQKIFGKISQISPENRKEIERLTQAQDDLNKKIEAKEATEERANAIKALREELADQVALGLAATEQDIEAADIIKELTGLTRAEEKTIRSLVKSIHAQTLANEKRAETQEKNKQRDEEAAKTISDLQQQIAYQTEKQNGATKAELLAIEVKGSYAKMTDVQREKIAELKGELEGLVTSNQAVDDAIQRGTQIAKGYITEQERIKKAEQDVNAALEAGKISKKEAEIALADLSRQMQLTDPMFAQFIESAEQAGNAIADSLADALVEGQLSMDNFMNIAKTFVKQLIAEFIRTYIIKRILSSIIPGGFFGGGGRVTGNASGGRVTIPGLAGGGTAGQRPILVGERGPELFVPGSAGSIKNNMDTQNLLSDAGRPPVIVQQTLNIETGVSQTVRAEIAGLMPQIRQDTVRAVEEARKRGGGFAAAFRA